MQRRTTQTAGGSDQIATALMTDGYSITRDFLAAPVVAELIAETRQTWDDGEFDYARVGQGAEKQRCPSVRSDRIHWLEPTDLKGAQKEYLSALEGLRLAVNRATMMGLFEWEGHLAIYPAGTFYRRHLDVFRHARQRKVSTILYLNEGWAVGDGGELRLYLNGTSREHFIDIEPRAGTLVTFLSEQFYHEVLPAHRQRMSITGWFRTRQ